MNKILLILKREFQTRVRKRSFIIMTIIGPILLAALIILPVYFAQMSDELKTIAVVDDTGLFYQRFPDSENIKFVYLNSGIDKAKQNFKKTKYYALLYIPLDSNNTVLPSSFFLFSNKQPSLIVKAYLENILKKNIENLKLAKEGINDNILASINTPISLTTIKIKSSGGEERSYSGISTILGIFGGILIYFFIFMYGALVMRGVIEEKTSRIVEVIMSSVKPFQLMMGKIIGVALVGLTQFLLWILLTIGIVFVVKQSLPAASNYVKTEKYMNPSSELGIKTYVKPNSESKSSNTQQESINKVFAEINSINIPVMTLSFIFYFICGYLLYAALFAAIGAAVDSEADTQQFMLPVTIPLLFSIIMLQFVINNPEGPVAFWLSIIPFTSPVIMMVRIPFGVPYWEMLISMCLLVVTFTGATWLAAKIYRTGILMYGKKISYKELWKWLRY